MSESNVTTESKSDGAGLPAVIEYETQSGVLLYVTPLSLFTVQAIINKSEIVHPYPSEVEYREPSELFASGFIPASENPDFQAACKAVDEQRQLWQNDAFIELACAYPQFEHNLAMMAHFRPRLEELRPYVEMHEDEWQNVLEHCVFTGVTDVVDEAGKRVRTTERFRVIQLARQNANVALTMPEVVGGLRVFRLSLPGQDAHRVDGSGTRGAKERN